MHSFLNRTSRSVSALVVMSMVLGLFAFAPIASAAQVVSSFSPAPGDMFKIHEGENFGTTVSIADMTDDVHVHFYVKGPLGEAGETEELIESYWYIAPGDYVFVWDGMIGGDYAMSGTYEIRVDADPILDTAPPDLTHEFEVEGAAHFSLAEPVSSPYYTTSPNDFEMLVDIFTLNPSCPRLRLGPTGEPNESMEVQMNLTTGQHTFTWDGMFGGDVAPAGEFSYHLFNDDIFCGDPAELKGTFMVSNDDFPAPTLSNLGATPDPFNPNEGTITLSYMLDGSLGETTIDAEVYNSADPGSPLETWHFENQGNGTNSVVWDGMDNGSVAADGAYVFRVWGEDVIATVVSQQTTFSIDTGVEEEEEEEEGPEPPAGPDQCAGFTDVLATHPSCDAMAYVKSIGAMTGNPDGSFAPTDILQRDQVTKISLETFGLFDPDADYCNGVDPFPDMPPAQWSYQYVCRGVQLEMITGYQSGPNAGKFLPSIGVNRVEFLALLLRNLAEAMPPLSSTSYADVAADQWFSGFARFSLDNDLFPGLNLFPEKGTTRVEVADAIFKLHEAGKV